MTSDIHSCSYFCDRPGCLKQQRNELREKLARAGSCHAAELADLTAERDALKADALRYRWLRDVGDSTFMALGKRPNVQFTHQIDAAIDEAMKAQT